MYVYYRAMSASEYAYIDRNEEVSSEVTWWAMSKEDAQRYMSEGKVIMKITLEAPIPAYYIGVAHYLGDTSHLEVKATKEEFNKHIAKTLVHVEKV